MAYREQFERMVRWYNRFSATAQGRAHDTTSDNYVDEIYAFFLNCYHLKDWIKNDPALPDTAKSGAEGWINSKLSLQICGDLCNSLKHFKLGKKPRSVESPVFGAKRFDVTLGESDLKQTISLKYEVDTVSGPKDAFQLATDCIAAWKEFLTKHSL